MAEVVELRAEDMVDELEEMEKQKLFDKQEIKNIVKRRKDFEYRLHRHMKKLEEFLEYISYEMSIMKMVSLRRRAKQLPAKKSQLEYSIANRVNRLYNEGIRRFSSEVRIWISYIRFCKQVKFIPSASRVFPQLLDLHGDKPALYKFAANWELEENQNIEKARKYLMNGIHIHKDSRLLYLEAFRLELIYTSLRQKEAQEKNIMNSSDPYQGGLAEVLYDSAVKKIHSVTFMVELLELARAYDFTTNLQNKIISDMRSKFPKEELTWDTVAKKTLNGVTKKKISQKERIRRCVKTYKLALKTVHTEKMWSMYLDTLLDLQKDSTKWPFPVLKRKCLSAAFLACHESKNLSEKYYLIWIEQLRKSCNKSSKKQTNKMEVDEVQKHSEEGSSAGVASTAPKSSTDSGQIEKTKKSSSGSLSKNPSELLRNILQESTKRLNKSVPLWETSLRLHLSWGEEDKSRELFKEANKCLGSEALPLWKLMLLYWQTKDSSKIEELLKEGTNLRDPKISNPLKVFWVERVAVTRGIAAARRLYVELVQLPPPCLELHTKMAELENLQPELNLKQSRAVYLLACSQFGRDNTDVWLNYVKFENKYGQPSHIADIYFKAVRSLNRSIIDVFKSEFNLEKGNAERMTK